MQIVHGGDDTVRGSSEIEWLAASRFENVTARQCRTTIHTPVFRTSVTRPKTNKEMVI